MNGIEQVEQVGGNIHTPTFTSDSGGFQCKKFFFTYHIKSGESFEQAFDRLKPLCAHCKDWIWSEEHGSSGETPHLQGAFVLRSKARASTLGKKYFLNGVSLFKLKDWKAAVDYCSKESNRIETSEKLPVALRRLPCEDALLAWQQCIISIVELEPCERSIYWFKGSGRSGKTTFCKHLHRKYNAICLAGKCADMKNGIVEFQKSNGDTPSLIVINLPRCFDLEYLSYTGVEECKDMFFYSGKYEGGMIDGNNPHLFVFSNELPSFSKMSEDRWQVYDIDADQWTHGIEAMKVFDSDSAGD